MSRPHVVQTVQLPSGRVLEIAPSLRAAEQAAPAAALPPPAAAADLATCERCGSKLVEPARWEAAQHDRWRLTLWCPNCEHVRDGIFSQACVDALDAHLDHATSSLLIDLKKLEHANMAEYVERFVAALGSGAILAEDFS